METLAKLFLSALETLEAEMRLLRALWARWAAGVMLGIVLLGLGAGFVAYGGALWASPYLGRPGAFAIAGAALWGLGAGCFKWALGPRKKGS
ncbi:MAG: hypothetical protein N2315_03460 [Thermanaerothrix sp.]|nr:hypothetical protein [Thermanaerothrix sp.]